MLGMGFAIMIPKHYKAHQLNITSAKIFNNVWYDITAYSSTSLLNHWRIILDTNPEYHLESGKVYLASISGTIS